MTGQAPALSIRRAVSRDIPEFIDLLRMVSDRTYPLETVRTTLSDLRPGEYYAWVAVAGSDLVGVTMLQPCVLEVSGNRCAAGYWTNLCVRPDYRRTTLYPRLLFAMMAGAAELGMDVVYGAIRRPDVLAGHLALGMENVGEMPVLVKPIRPTRLVSKYKGFGSLAAQLGNLPDYFYSKYRLIRRSSSSSPYSIKDSRAVGCDPDIYMPALRAAFSSQVQQPLTAESFGKRYHANPDGDEYRILSVQRSGSTQAAIVYRSAVRGPEIRSFVIMEMGHQLSQEDALRFGLLELEKRAAESDCDVILCLSSSLGMQAALRNAGYFKSNEKYVLIKKLTGRKPACVLPAKIGDWHFTFADHDAF
ncbi:MAG TPA: GNAT family N-acetyltransferase [Terriglobia bacterium]